MSVKFVRLQAEGVLDRLGDVVRQQALAELPQEVADPFGAVVLLDEVEGRLAVTVGQEVERLQPVDRRDEPVHHGIADDHPVEVVFVAPQVAGETFHDPGGHVGAEGARQRLLVQDAELEDVRQLVADERVLLVGRDIHRQDHAVLDRQGEGSDELGDELEQGIGLLELHVRLVVDERDAELDLVVEELRQPHVLALGVGDDFLEERLLLRIVVHVEVRRLVEVPVEVLVGDLVLPERENAARAQDGRGDEHGTGGQAKAFQACSYSVKMNRCAVLGFAITIPSTSSSNCSNREYRAVRRSVPWPFTVLSPLN